MEGLAGNSRPFLPFFGPKLCGDRARSKTCAGGAKSGIYSQRSEHPPRVRAQRARPLLGGGAVRRKPQEGWGARARKRRYVAYLATRRAASSHARMHPMQVLENFWPRISLTRWWCQRTASSRVRWKRGSTVPVSMPSPTRVGLRECKGGTVGEFVREARDAGRGVCRHAPSNDLEVRSYTSGRGARTVM